MHALVKANTSTIVLFILSTTFFVLGFSSAGGARSISYAMMILVWVAMAFLFIGGILLNPEKSGEDLPYKFIWIFGLSLMLVNTAHSLVMVS